MSAKQTSQAPFMGRGWRALALAAVVLGLLLVVAYQLGRRSPLLIAETTEVRAEPGPTAHAKMGNAGAEKHAHEEGHEGHADEAAHAGHTEAAEATEGGDHEKHEAEEAHAEHEEGVANFTPTALAKAGIEVRTVAETAVRAHLSVTGTVEPNLRGVVKVTPRVAGKITSLRATIGDPVRAGQVLATMTSTDLAAAQAQYRQASARVQAAQANLRRQHQLAAFGEFGQHKVQEARGNFNAAQGDVNEAVAEINAARNEVAEAEAALAAARGDEVSARNDVTAAETAVTQSETQIEVTRSRFGRQEALLKEQLTSRQDWEQARADHQKAEADLLAARAAVGSAMAKVEAAQAKTRQAKAVIATHQARLRQAQAKQAAARQRLEIARVALAREEKVYRSGVFASKEVADAEAALRHAQIERSAATDAVRLLGGSPGAGNTLAVAAPLSGRVTERTVTAGETVSPEKALFTVVNLESVWVQLSVYSRDLPSVRDGLPVAITTDAVPGRRFIGKVAYVSDMVDETTRTVKVRCVIPNPGSKLKPEMFVRGHIETPMRRQAIAVPRDAVQTLDGKSVVFVPGDHTGEFQAREVRPGETVDGRIIIAQGLAAGERVVTKGAFIVKAQTMKGELGHSHAH
jgi:cobalt-zinc-cadmium efflux system membrane fusion protein